jgi:hypothetical protein
MATFTAHVLIGRTHPNHDGILPTHTILLSENSRAALVLVPFDVWGDDEFQPDLPTSRRIVWIPHPDYIVDDLMLQVGVHVLRESEAIAQAKTIVDDIVTADNVDLSDLTADDRKMLSAACHTVKDFPKLVVTVLTGSTLLRSVVCFENYSMDIEVCTVAYQRLYSPWTKQFRIVGDLTGIQNI